MLRGILDQRDSWFRTSAFGLLRCALRGEKTRRPCRREDAHPTGENASNSQSNERCRPPFWRKMSSRAETPWDYEWSQRRLKLTLGCDGSWLFDDEQPWVVGTLMATTSSLKPMYYIQVFVELVRLV